MEPLLLEIPGGKQFCMTFAMLKVIYGAVNKDIVKQRQACHFMTLLPPVFLLLTAPVNLPEHITDNDSKACFIMSASIYLLF